MTMTDNNQRTRRIALGRSYKATRSLYELITGLPPLEPLLQPGDLVTSALFPGRQMVVQADGTLQPLEPFKPGDRMQYPMGEWYILQPDGKTWSHE